MKYTVEEPLSNFKAWSGAKYTMNELTTEELDQLESMMEECEPGEGWSDTAINDFLWFERDLIAEWLGYEDWDDLCRKHAGEEEDQDEE